jgi:hypothetical protein
MRGARGLEERIPRPSAAFCLSSVVWRRLRAIKTNQQVRTSAVNVDE